MRISGIPTKYLLAYPLSSGMKLHACNSRSSEWMKIRNDNNHWTENLRVSFLKNQPQEFQSRLVISFFKIADISEKKTGSKTTRWKYATVSKAS